MFKTVYFESINTAPKYQEVLFRMGYKKGITTMSAADEKKLEKGLAAAAGLCVLKGAYLICGISSAGNGAVGLEGGEMIRSSDLADLFEGCTHAAVMAATAGSAVVDAVRKETSQGSGSLGVVMDAYASEAADAALDWVNEFVRAQYAKKGMGTTRRFSPGYGDLKLEYQALFYRMLDLEKIGISITDRCLLVPEKSVIGICGIR